MIEHMTPKVARMSPVEGRAWLALISTAELLPARLDAQLLAQAGLIHFEYAVLNILQTSNDQPIRMGCLASVLACPASKLSKAVSRLEARGLVERQASAEDRRAINVTLTHEGRKMWLSVTPTHVEFARDTILAALNEDQLELLADLLEPILDRLTPEDAPRISGETGVCKTAESPSN